MLLSNYFLCVRGVVVGVYSVCTGGCYFKSLQRFPALNCLAKLRLQLPSTTAYLYFERSFSTPECYNSYVRYVNKCENCVIIPTFTSLVWKFLAVYILFINLTSQLTQLSKEPRLRYNISIEFPAGMLLMIDVLIRDSKMGGV